MRKKLIKNNQKKMNEELNPERRGTSCAFLDLYILSPECCGAPLRAHSFCLWNPTLLGE